MCFSVPWVCSFPSKRGDLVSFVRRERCLFFFVVENEQRCVPFLRNGKTRCLSFEGRDMFFFLFSLRMSINVFLSFEAERIAFLSFKVENLARAETDK